MELRRLKRSYQTTIKSAEKLATSHSFQVCDHDCSVSSSSGIDDILVIATDTVIVLNLNAELLGLNGLPVPVRT